ncbi:MAG: rhodanese-like domain-containing protein [Sporolactobacillus sp.]
MGWLSFLKPAYQQISVKQLKEDYLSKKQGRIFIDVRTSNEFSRRSISGFRNVPLQTLPAQISRLPQDKEIIVICQSGMRSASACKMLSKAGFSQVVNVRGGMNGWL